MRKAFLFAAALTSALAVGCMKDKVERQPAPSQSDYFNYETVKEYTLTVNYNCGYMVQFELYAQDPYKTVGQGQMAARVKDNTVKPVYRAFTDNAGSFSEKINIPAYMEDLYLFCDYPGVADLLEMQISGSAITVKPVQSVSAMKTKAVTWDSNVSATRPLYFMSEDYAWDISNGRCNMMSEVREEVSMNLLSAIHGTIREGYDLRVSHPELFNDQMSGSINLIGDEGETFPVEMIFLHGVTSYNDAIGYYTYPTGNKPAVEDLHRILAIPFAKYDGMHGGGLVIGDKIKLKYYNTATGLYEEEFPAGTTIGFFEIANGYWNHQIFSSSYDYYTDYREYSMPYANGAPAERQIVTLFNDESGMAVIGFEDLAVGNPADNCDFDFNDVVIGVKCAAIDPGTIVPIETPEFDPETDNVLEFSGTMAFEDLWPNHGDFDINDVVLKYHSIQKRDLYNQVVGTVDTLWPVWCGASYHNGFGVQYGIEPSYVREMNFKTSFRAPTSYSLGAKGFENGQNKATVMLFDDVRASGLVNGSFGNTPVETPHYFEIKITLNSPVKDWQIGVPPYNPFVVVRPEVGSTARGKEVHLSGKEPTTLADRSQYFGTGFDRSDLSTWYTWYTSRPVKESELTGEAFNAGSWRWPAEGIAMPFAINFPGDFTWPTEGKAIYNVFPKFGPWVASSGWEYKDWWRNPAQ